MISPSCSLVINTCNDSNRYYEDNSVLYGNFDRSSVSNKGNSQQCVSQTNTVYAQTARFHSDARQPLSSICDVPVSVSNQTVNCAAGSNAYESVDVPNNHENKEITTMGDDHSGYIIIVHKPRNLDIQTMSLCKCELVLIKGGQHI